VLGQDSQQQECAGRNAKRVEARLSDCDARMLGCSVLARTDMLAMVSLGRPKHHPANPSQHRILRK